MKNWQDLTHYAGFDWAKDHHAIVVVDKAGTVVADFEFKHSLEGWKSFVEKTAIWPNLAVAIETSRGAAVDQLLQRQYTVFPVHPVSAKGYRERKAPSGTKTDHLDAWGMADALRMDGHGWKTLQPMDPLTEQLRLLCRDEVGLIEQRTALVNQLQQALSEYYPVALEAFDDWTADFTWEFVIAFPMPEILAGAGRRKWENFLHKHKLWRPETSEKRLKLFAQANQFQASKPIALAKSQLAVSLCQLLRTLGQQLALYRKQIEALFEDHPDHDLFGSLPGARKVLGPRLLGFVGIDPKPLRQPRSASGLCRDCACVLSIRQHQQGPCPLVMRQALEAHGSPLGGLLSQSQRLGPDLLRKETRRGEEPRLRVEMPGTKAAENPLPNDQEQGTLRRRVARPEPEKARIMGH
jgi:transposase